MRNIAVITARAGSKGLKDKNIKLLDGKPLLAYSIEAAKKSGLFDEIMVSTDSEKYAEIAVNSGANVPFLRSEELSNDTATSWNVLKEVLNMYESMGKKFDTVALLQPTSPLRTSNDIVKGYEVFNKKNANFVVAICEMDHSPLWSNTLSSDHSMNDFIRPEVFNIRRQDTPKYYRINGALYIINVDYLMKSSNIYAERSYATLMKKENSIDIDDIVDFKIAEIFLNEFKTSD